MTTSKKLLSPFSLGRLVLPNRIVMAPLTRNRVGPGNVPTAMMVKYYAQRASAGLIISEATQISPEAQGYDLTPGIHSAEQIAGWREVTDAVHERGGRIFLQLWHVGRVSNVALQPGGVAPVAPSAIQAQARTWVAGDFVATSPPRALTLEEIPDVVAKYRRAAANAIAAGFDGVELHGANGYLIDQFLRDGSNHRTDAYGGSIENRVRFLREVAQAVADEIGGDRLGVRLSPVTPANGAFDSDPLPLFFHAVETLNTVAPAYLHVIEGETRGARDFGPALDYRKIRQAFRGAYIGNNGYDFGLAERAVGDGATDLVAFGRAYIANPDLVERYAHGAPLNEPHVPSFYGGDDAGYTDYPQMDDIVSRA
ncbi:alkene reductase [Pandoraea fibrosis]|nr:alkene reductase [Pandoraea fibrosis]